MVPSIRRASPRVGAIPRASTTLATPSSRSAAIAFGATSNAKPSSRTDDARSNTPTRQPALRREMAAARPPMPAPTMRAFAGHAEESSEHTDMDP